MGGNEKNPQKAPQHHSRRKLRPTYRPTNNIHTHKKKKSKMYIQKLKELQM